MAAAISSTSRKGTWRRLKNKRTMMAIGQSTAFISQALGGMGTLSNDEKKKDNRKDYIVNTGPNKGARVKASEGIPFGAVMHILRENRRDRQYKDLVKFFFFLILFVYIQFELRRVFDSHFGQAGIRDALVDEWLVEPDMPHQPFADPRTFETTGNWEEYFMWMEGPFTSVLFRNEWYNEQSRGNYTRSQKPKRYLGIQSHILGKIIMRQVRGKPVPTQVLDDGEMYDVYPDFEDSSFVPEAAANGTVHPVYGTYMTHMSKIEGVSTGPMTWTQFGRGSWMHLFEHDQENATKLIQHLKKNLYCDQATRVISIDFVIINPSNNVMIAVRLMWESTTQGVMRHKSHIMAMPINMYRTFRHKIRAGVEACFVIGLFWFTAIEIHELFQHKIGLYLSSMWNRLEVINICLFWFGLGCHFIFFYNWAFKVDWISSEYLDIFDLGYMFQLNARIAAGNTLLSFLKVFKYLQVSDRFNLLWITLGKAAHDLISFLIIFSLFMIGFGVVGMLIFGPDIQNYSTLSATLFTLFQMLLGDFDYDALRVSAPLVAPIYFFTYIIAVFFILMNMMISIIIMGFEQAKSEQATKQMNYIQVPFVYDTVTTKQKTCRLRCSKFCGSVHLLPHQFRNNNHAVHLLADPKKQTKIADSELLTLNGYHQEGKDVIAQEVMDKKSSGFAGDSKTENVGKIALEKAKKAAKKAKFLRLQVSKSTYEHWMDNIVLAQRLKNLFNAPGIKRAYKRLLVIESKLDGDVYGKVLSVSDLSTVLGLDSATETIFLYTKINGNSVHDSASHFFHHSDSWHIKKTAEDIDLMQTALDNVLTMVTILAQQAQQNRDDLNGSQSTKKSKKSKKKMKDKVPFDLNEDTKNSAPPPPSKVVPFSPVGGSKEAPEASKMSSMKKSKSIRF